MAQQPRRAYHRLKDLERLDALIRCYRLPMRVTDETNYTVREVAADGSSGAIPLMTGRYQIIYTYIMGWRDARANNGEPWP